VADLSLDKAMLQDVLSKKAVKRAKQRKLAGDMQGQFGISQQRVGPH